MSDYTEDELKEVMDILIQNAKSLNKLRVKRAAEEFDPENPVMDKGLDLEYIKKNHGP